MVVKHGVEAGVEVKRLDEATSVVQTKDFVYYVFILLLIYPRKIGIGRSKTVKELQRVI